MSIKKLTLFFVCLIPINCFCLTKAPIDITKMDINSLHNALKNKIITSEQLVNLYLDRINTYNDYNAIISINEKALNEAKKLDKEISKGKFRSKLHGLPIIVKDNIDAEGIPTTAGAKALKDNYPSADATVIQKLKEAGAIIIAKSNMSEFAFQASSSRSSYGLVKNAYNKDYSSYGSSGGSAVSVALNFAIAALGTDTNSSVRVPAAAANIIGYRPTNGLISHEGVLPYDPERDTIGILTKNINDLVIINNIIHGYDEKDSKSIKQEYKNIQITTKSLNNITIGVPSNFLTGSDEHNLPENKETYKEITSLMGKAISKMENDGAKIIYLDDYYTYTENNYATTTYSGYLFCDSFNEYLKNHQSKIKNFNDLVKSLNITTDLSGYAKNCNTTQSLTLKNEKKQKYADLLAKIYKDNNLDVIIYPTTKNKLLKNGTSGIVNLSAHAASTVSFPAISMPLGFDSDNLPYGIEFMALNKNDTKLINIAHRYEELNSNTILPKEAPNLYQVDSNVEKLIYNYSESKKCFLKNKWNKKVQKYFKNYNTNSNYIKDAIKLNNELYFRIIIRKLLASLSICLLYFFLKPKTVKYIK